MLSVANAPPRAAQHVADMFDVFVFSRPYPGAVFFNLRLKARIVHGWDGSVRPIRPINASLIVQPITPLGEHGRRTRV